MASLTWWKWFWVNSGSWWWTGRPGVLRFMGLQRVGHDWATELNWNLANTVFPQHKRRLYTWSSPDGQHRNRIDYILCSQKRRNSIQSAKTGLEADCGSDHELLIAKFRLKLMKIGKTTRPFRYGLNQIPYDYMMKVRNTFKGLDPIECLMSYGRRFVTLYRGRWSRPSPRKRNARRQSGCLGGLTNS